MVRPYYLGMTQMLVAARLAAQAAGVPAELEQRANQAFTAKDMAAAVAAYGDIVRLTPDAALPHFRLGVSLIGIRRHAEAAAHLARAESLGTPASQTAFWLALVHARAGRRDEAFQQLGRATAAGLVVLPSQIDPEPDLAPLKSDRRYGEFLTGLDRNARPCMHDPKFSEFDFWLGDWAVRRNTTPPPPGPGARNVITKIHDGCVVLESYTAPGYTGQSFNIYDRTRKQWNQTWVDKTGGLHVYWGEVRDGNMYYEGEMPDPTNPGARVRTRLTFFRIEADTVRQFSESTRDSGKTWTVNYDLLYTRRVP